MRGLSFHPVYHAIIVLIYSARIYYNYHVIGAIVKRRT